MQRETRKAKAKGQRAKAKGQRTEGASRPSPAARTPPRGFTLAALPAMVDRLTPPKEGLRWHRTRYGAGMLPHFWMRSVCALVGFADVAAAEDVLRPNDQLAVDGVPAIASSVATKAQKYTDYRAALFAAWLPASRQVLALTRFAETPQVHLVRQPGGDRKQLTFFPDRVQAASFPRANAGYFLLTKDVGGNEFFQHYRFDLKTGDVELLTDGRARNEPGVWSHGGNRYVYTSTRRDGRSNDFYVVTDGRRETDRLLSEVQGTGWEPSDWSPDDRTIVVRQAISINEARLYLVDVATGRMRPALPGDGGSERVAYDGAKFSADGRSLYVTTDRGSEWKRLGRVDLETGHFEPISAGIEWNVERFSLTPDGKRLAFVTNEDGISRIYLVETASNGVTPVRNVPDGVIYTLDWSNDGRDLAFTLGSADTPADVFSVNPATGAVDRWTESETGGIAPESFVKPELVRWPSFDGRSLSGFLYRPTAAGAKPLPVIVNIHGGPEAQSRPAFLGRSNYFLNELGVALIYPNVRGSDGYGKTFLDLDNGTKREDAVKDIGALLDWIRTRPDLDPDRVMITGGSYGGYMTLACSVHYADRIRCSVDVVGISNFVTFLERTEAYRRDLRRVEYGDERDPTMRAFLEKISPLNGVDRITKPLFIVSGQNDPRVPVGEGRQMVEALRAKGRTVWSLVAKDEGHGFAKKANADFQFYATVQFVEDYLLK